MKTINAVPLAEALGKTGIDCITIHPRTRSELYQGNPRWDLLPLLKNSLSVPVTASGNIRTPEDITHISSLGADAFMVGRGAVGNPWIFRELSGGSPPTIEERREVMLEHLDMLSVLFGKDKSVRYIRKFLSAYVRGLHDAAVFRMKSCSAPDINTLKDIINNYCSSLS